MAEQRWRQINAPHLKFQREGITSDELSEEDKDQWDALEWVDEGTVPDRVEGRGRQQVAVQHRHRGQGARAPDDAEFIAERFNANYPHFRSEFARVITFKTEYAQSLFDSFSN